MLLFVIWSRKKPYKVQSCSLGRGEHPVWNCWADTFGQVGTMVMVRGYELRKGGEGGERPLGQHSLNRLSVAPESTVGWLSQRGNQRSHVQYSNYLEWGDTQHSMSESGANIVTSGEWQKSLENISSLFFCYSSAPNNNQMPQHSLFCCETIHSKSKLPRFQETANNLEFFICGICAAFFDQSVWTECINRPFFFY